MYCNIKNSNNFDIARLSLSLFVLIYHFGIFFNVKYLNIIGNIDSVACFFVISGYLVSTSFARSANIINYLIKRAKRIIPGVYFVTIGSLVLGLFITNLTFSEYILNFSTIKFIVANFIFVNALHPTLPGVFTNDSINHGYINGSLWTLKFEIICYLLVPLVFYIKNKKYLLFFWFAIILGATIVNLYKPYFANILHIISCFVAGVLFYFYQPLLNKALNNKTFLYLWICAMLYLLIFNPVLPQKSLIIPFVILYFTIYFPYKFKINEKIGDLSYGIYIYHFPILQTLKSKNFNPCASLSITIFTTLLCAYFSWHYIEKQFLSKK